MRVLPILQYLRLNILLTQDSYLKYMWHFKHYFIL